MVLGGLWTLVKGAWASREPGTTSRALLESGPGGQPGRPGLRPLPGVSCSMDHRPGRQLSRARTQSGSGPLQVTQCVHVGLCTHLCL